MRVPYSETSAFVESTIQGTDLIIKKYGDLIRTQIPEEKELLVPKYLSFMWIEEIATYLLFIFYD